MNKEIMGIEEFVQKNNIASKKFLIRADFNVPISNGEIVEDMRLKAVIPTLDLLIAGGAKIILISHIEAEDVDLLGQKGMAIVAKYFNEKLDRSVQFVSGDGVIDDAVESSISNMKDGEMILLDNLRINPGEKNNDEDFSKKLAGLADFYVNEAFSVSHRKHASVVGVPKFLPHFAGIELLNEINSLKTAINPPHPFVFILGGAKFDTKLSLIKKFLDKADYVILGGALINDVYKARGYNIGKSLVSDGNIDISDIVNNEKIILAKDVVVYNAENIDSIYIKKIEDVSDSDVICDLGPSILEELKNVISDARFVLWNGPLGNYEKGFKDQTVACAKLLVESKIKGAIGGGDTVAAIQNVDKDLDLNLFISTGGGAMIDFLINESLPGIDALR